MTTIESKALQIIWMWGGEASIDTIARELKVSVDYARLVCEELGKYDFIDLLGLKLCRIKNKGKLAVAKQGDHYPKRIVVEQSRSRFGLGKPRRIPPGRDLPGGNKKGRFVLGY